MNSERRGGWISGIQFALVPDGENHDLILRGIEPVLHQISGPSSEYDQFTPRLIQGAANQGMRLQDPDPLDDQRDRLRGRRGIRFMQERSKPLQVFKRRWGDPEDRHASGLSA